MVRNRIKNAMELFFTRNQLERKVQEQAEALKEQNEIIQIQTEKLKQEKSFNRLMMEYHSVIMEVETRLKVFNG